MNPICSFLYYLLKMLNKKIVPKGDKFNHILESIIKNVIEKISDGWIKFNEGDKQNTLEKVLDSVVTTEYINEQIGILLQELKSEKFNKLIIFID